MFKNRDCNNCACCNVCGMRDKNMTCENWIGAEELKALRERKNFLPRMMQVDSCSRIGNIAKASEIMGTTMSSLMEDQEKYMKSFYPQDWPFVLGAMKAFVEFQLVNAPVELRAMAQKLAESVTCIRVDVGAARHD